MRLYIRLSCDVLTDAKILQVGPEAAFVWVRGLLYAKEHLTDGFVPRHALSLVTLGVTGDDDAVTTRLVDAGLWKIVDGGWHVGVDKWGRHQTTREEVERIRALWRERQARARGKVTQSITSVSRVTHARITRPESESESENKEKRESRKRPTLSAVADPPVPPNGHDHDHGTPDDLAAAWNTALHPPLAAVRLPLNPTRVKAARLRLKEHPDSEYWHEVFTAIRGSPFCLGQNDRGWRANFDWLLRPGSADKALEGQYRNAPKPPVLQRYV